ncbi:MAG: RHS repeat-associated core domain-containing protein, partial [Bacteroidales bacterium]|nr:RHS repeat-associated core domain-containing protein [Bacteroidales bacterium]
QNDLNCIASYGDVPDEDLKVPLYGVPYYFHTEAVTKLKRIHKAVERCEQETEEEDKVFFYHSDHLGSASWITNRDGDAIQHLQYLPYGEPFVDQRMSGYNERFTFTGKERDEETGYGYFGARYMDHELMTMWLSVDPMADKYPNISPYAYCAWNPVKLVDLDGMDTTIIFNLDNGLIYRQEDKNRKGLYFVQVEHGEYTTIYSGNTSYDKVNVGNNRTIISFKDAKQALAIYNHLKECKVQFEWNLMYLKNGSADLVTSASPDKIKMDPDDYSSENVQRWRHYHPSLPGYLYWMPSKEDQQFAQSLGLCSSILDFCNQEYDFAPIIKENNLIDAKQYRRYERILKNKYPTIRTTCE